MLSKIFFKRVAFGTISLQEKKERRENPKMGNSPRGIGGEGDAKVVLGEIKDDDEWCN